MPMHYVPGILEFWNPERLRWERVRPSRKETGKKRGPYNKKKPKGPYIRKKKVFFKDTIQTCLHCGKAFSADSKRKYCSMECHFKSVKQKALTITLTSNCLNCKKRFKHPQSKRPKFCSTDCFYVYRKRNYKPKLRLKGQSSKIAYCAICGQVFKEIKDRHTVCSSGCGAIYAKARAKARQDAGNILCRCSWCGRFIWKIKSSAKRRTNLFCDTHCYTAWMDDSPKKKDPRKKREYTRNRILALERDEYRCQYCGKTVKDGITLEVDHIIPVSKGGSNKLENLRTSCRDCNNGKRDMIISSPL